MFGMSNMEDPMQIPNKDRILRSRILRLLQTIKNLNSTVDVVDTRNKILTLEIENLKKNFESVCEECEVSSSLERFVLQSQTDFDRLYFQLLSKYRYNDSEARLINARPEEKPLPREATSSVRNGSEGMRRSRFEDRIPPRQRSPVDMFSHHRSRSPGPSQSFRRQSPIRGRQPPIRGRQPQIHGRQSPFGGRQSPFGGRQSPFCGRQSPVRGRHSPIRGQQPTIRGLQPPILGRQSHLSQTDQFIIEQQRSFQQPLLDQAEIVFQQQREMLNREVGFSSQIQPLASFQNVGFSSVAFSKGGNFVEGPPTVNPKRPPNEVCICGKLHAIYKCDYLKRLTPAERYQKIKTNRLCFGCLGSHSFDVCKSRGSCKYCGSSRHHTILHNDAIHQQGAKGRARSNSPLLDQGRRRSPRRRSPPAPGRPEVLSKRRFRPY